METVHYTREQLAEYILHEAKSSLIEKIKSFISQEKQEVVAYTTDGKPLTREGYFLQLEQSEEEIENGEFISQEELDSESQSW